MQHRTTRALVLAIAAAVLAPAGAHAATIYVNDDTSEASCPIPGSFYFEIQDAVDVAAPGDTIRVCPGDYNGNVSSNKEGLYFIGPQAGVNPRSRPIDGSGGGEAVVRGQNGLIATGAGVVVDGFTVLRHPEGFANIGLYLDGDDAVVRNTIVTRMGTGIVVENGAFALGNRVTGQASSLAGINASADGTHILDNSVSDVGGYGIVVNGGVSDTEVRNNLLSNNATAPSSTSGASDPADCKDFSQGNGTAGTASVWAENTGARSSKPAGICALPAPVICPGIGVLNPLLGSPLRLIGRTITPIDPLIRAICGV